MFQKGYKGGTVKKLVDEMYNLVVNELSFYDIQSELLRNTCLQKQEQVWHCCVRITEVKYKKISFECIPNAKTIAGTIKIGDFM